MDSKTHVFSGQIRISKWVFCRRVMISHRLVCSVRVRTHIWSLLDHVCRVGQKPRNQWYWILGVSIWTNVSMSLFLVDLLLQYGPNRLPYLPVWKSDHRYCRETDLLLSWTKSWYRIQIFDFLRWQHRNFSFGFPIHKRVHSLFVNG